MLTQIINIAFKTLSGEASGAVKQSLWRFNHKGTQTQRNGLTGVTPCSTQIINIALIPEAE